MLQTSVCNSPRRRQCNENKNSLREMDLEHQRLRDGMLLQRGSGEVGPDGDNGGTSSWNSQCRTCTNVRYL